MLTIIEIERVIDELVVYVKSLRNGPLKNQGLRAAIEKERIFGLSTNQTADLNNEMIKFNYPWILVEEFSGNFKPVVRKEYPDGGPRIYSRHSIRTVFSPDTEVEEADNAQKSRKKYSQALLNTAASGQRLSQTTAPMEIRPLNNASINKLNNRVIDGVKLNHRVAELRTLKLNNKLQSKGNPARSAKRKKIESPFKPRKRYKKRANVVGMGFYAKEGYCENCGVQYENYGDHMMVCLKNLTIV